MTIAGSNFDVGATVTFGEAVAEDAFVLSSSQITCTAPAHYPATVDVHVTNVGGQRGTLLQGFTYESDVALLSLPNTAGEQYSIVQVPINAASVQGLAAADLSVGFDSAVLTARGASLGNLTPGWNLATNTTIPGQVTLAMASPGGTVSGSGVLAYLEFEVVGSPAMTTNLAFTAVSLNDGAIPVEDRAGSFLVSLVYDVSGVARFWENSAGVNNVLLTLGGDRSYSDVTDAFGVYTVTGAASGNYTLTAAKSDEADGISSYDASLGLQHSAGLITLAGHQATAADVNRNAAITSMDAFYILQKAVDLIGLPFPGAGVVWDFDPANRSYTNLSSDLVGQNFTAILLGDVSGNWSASGDVAATARGPAVQVRSQSLTATLSLPQIGVLPGQQITVPLRLTLPEGAVYGVDITLLFDQGVVSPTSVLLGGLAEGWSMASNLGNPGELRVGLAGAMPITADGDLLLFVFEALGSGRSETDLTLARGDLNEGAIPVRLIDGHVCTFHLHLPIVLRDAQLQ